MKHKIVFFTVFVLFLSLFLLDGVRVDAVTQLPPINVGSPKPDSTKKETNTATSANDACKLIPDKQEYDCVKSKPTFEKKKNVSNNGSISSTVTVTNLCGKPCTTGTSIATGGVTKGKCTPEGKCKGELFNDKPLDKKDEPMKSVVEKKDEPKSSGSKVVDHASNKASAGKISDPSVAKALDGSAKKNTPPPIFSQYPLGGYDLKTISNPKGYDGGNALKQLQKYSGSGGSNSYGFSTTQSGYAPNSYSPTYSMPADLSGLGYHNIGGGIGSQPSYSPSGQSFGPPSPPNSYQPPAFTYQPINYSPQGSTFGGNSGSSGGVGPLPEQAGGSEPRGKYADFGQPTYKYSSIPDTPNSLSNVLKPQPPNDQPSGAGNTNKYFGKLSEQFGDGANTIQQGAAGIGRDIRNGLDIVAQNTLPTLARIPNTISNISAGYYAQLQKAVSGGEPLVSNISSDNTQSRSGNNNDLPQSAADLGWDNKYKIMGTYADNLAGQQFSGGSGFSPRTITSGNSGGSFGNGGSSSGGVRGSAYNAAYVAPYLSESSGGSVAPNQYSQQPIPNNTSYSSNNYRQVPLSQPSNPTFNSVVRNVVYTSPSYNYNTSRPSFNYTGNAQTAFNVAPQNTFYMPYYF